VTAIETCPLTAISSPCVLVAGSTTPPAAPSAMPSQCSTRRAFTDTTCARRAVARPFRRAPTRQMRRYALSLGEPSRRSVASFGTPPRSGFGRVPSRTARDAPRSIAAVQRAGPLLTARWIAAQRARLGAARPVGVDGDPDAEQQLYAGFSRFLALPGLRRRAGRRSAAHVRLWLVASTACRMSWVAASGCDTKET
jgi:hypothetical protein